MKSNPSKINFADVKILRIVFFVFILVLLILDLSLFISFHAQMEKAQVRLSKQKQALLFFKDLIFKKDKIKKVPFVSKDGLEVVLDKIVVMGRQNNLDVEIGEMINVQKKDDKKVPFEWVEVGLSFEGNFKSIGQFLIGLKGMEKAVIDVRSFNFVLDKMNPSIIQVKISIGILTVPNGSGQKLDIDSDMSVEEQWLKQMTAEKSKIKPLSVSWADRDPFIDVLISPPVEVKTAHGKKQGFVLQGIFLGGRPSVIINDKVLGLGDSIKGVVVKKIEEKRVELIDTEGKIKVLSLTK
ncbi:MAG: hypothetical protein HQL13_03610 [Candidatus Omnitrophica bacterium]|nr:hypothetical protein [Candidatus Omnitrophota bacterium]